MCSKVVFMMQRKRTRLALAEMDACSINALESARKLSRKETNSANMNPPESFAFARGPRALDRSVWYSGWLLTFLATAEETRGQFALIEATARKGNVPPRHIHRREEETFYVLDGKMNVTVGDRTFKATAGTLVSLPRNVAHSFAIESEQLRTLILP